MPPIKLYKPLVDVVRTGLQHIFEEGSYADKEVQKILRGNKQFGSKDRSFIAETIYDIVRWKRNYEHFVTAENDAEKAGYDDLILLSLAQRQYELLNPEVLFSDIRAAKIPLDDRQSFPEWLDVRCSKELGERWTAIAAALNKPAAVYLRSNSIRIKAGDLLNMLKAAGIEARVVSAPEDPGEAITFPNNAIELLSKNNLRQSKGYKEGLFEFQDIGSQLIGEFCSVKTGQTVLDLCAGAGGKTLQLSALMLNGGKLYATDRHAHRLEQLQKRAHQAGCRNIRIILFEKAKDLRNIDVLLIDAPCSGLGTIKRHPDIKWKLKEADIDAYIRIQAALLDEYKNIVSAQGKIIYATCSILPSESEEQVDHFLKSNPGFQLTRAYRVNPDTLNADGFYMAELQRKKI